MYCWDVSNIYLLLYFLHENLNYYVAGRAETYAVWLISVIVITAAVTISVTLFICLRCRNRKNVSKVCYYDKTL